MAPLARPMALAAAAMLLPMAANADDRDAVPQLVEDAVVAVNEGGSAALASLLADGALVVVGGEESATVLSRDEACARLADAAAWLGLPLRLDIAQADILGHVALVRGTLRRDEQDGAEPLWAVAVRVQDAWRLLFIVLPRGHARDVQAPPEVDAVLSDIEADGETGMQAALAHLPDALCVAVLGLPDAPLVMLGREQIAAAIGAWAPPTDARVMGRRVVRMGGNVALALFDSSVQTGPNWLDLRNLVVLTKSADGWHVTLFAAAAIPGA